jgi:hypothetical protein
MEGGVRHVQQRFVAIAVFGAPLGAPSARRREQHDGRVPIGVDTTLGGDKAAEEPA